MKTCCTCKRELPLAEFGKDRQTPDGYRRRCRECKRAEAKAYREKNREAIADYQREWRENNRERVNARSKAWRDVNRESHLASKKKWREANPDAGREYAAANREQRNEYMRRWRAENPDKYREASRRSNRARYERNPHAAVEWANRRRALILERTVGEVDPAALWRSQCGICALCGERIDDSLGWPHPMSKSLDHILPLSRGGTHEQSNLQWTHLVENQQKGASVPARTPS